MRTLLYFSILVTLAACATTGSRVTKLSPGMSKSQVLDIMGDPDSSKGEGNSEVLVYGANWVWTSERGEYWIKLVDGKVTKYGRPQDVGQPVPTHVILDQNVTNK